MKILVCGFYFHDNFGDDCFVMCFNKIFDGHELTFVEVTTIGNIDLTKYDAVVVGGGDLLNDFYGLKYTEVLMNYSGYKIAIGVGVSFEECLSREYLLAFDDIVLRSKTDLKKISRVLGSLNTHYLPDLAFSLDTPPRNEQIDGKNIGLFLVGSMMTNRSLLFTILRLTDWVLSKGYILHLIPMYHEEGIQNTDVHMNEYVASVSRQYADRIISHDKYGHDKYVEVVSQLDLAICVRFHSHVYCTLIGIPFLSIPLTRKVELYNKELPESAFNPINVIRDSKYNLISIDVKDAKRKFNYIADNRDVIRKDLLHNADLSKSSYRHHKLRNLVENGKKRVVQPQSIIIADPEKTYIKYRDAFLIRGVNHLVDNPLELLDVRTVNNLADLLCYDITHDTSNEYAYGTRINLINNLSKLRDIIYYIYNDYRSKHELPRINMNFIKQDSFKGLHRAGWSYSVGPLYAYSGDSGVFLDLYGDRTFGWASDVLYNTGLIPYTNYWVGFFHHTFEEEFSDNNCAKIFSSSVFITSLNLCRGIFCLTEYLANEFRTRLASMGFDYIPVRSLHHPTIFVSDVFDMEKFRQNSCRKLVNVGSWYRNPITIFRVGSVKNDIVTYHSLRGKRMDSNFCPDELKVSIVDGKIQTNGNIWSRYYIKYINSKCDDYSVEQNELVTRLLNENSEIDLRSHGGCDLLSDFLGRVNILEDLPNDQYDKLFVDNIVFLDLVDSSTVNTILEVIVRKTPVVVNRMTPTIELLGVDYPLFYDDVSQIQELLTFDKIQEAHEYMKTIDDNKYRLDSFVESFLNSDIYQTL